MSYRIVSDSACDMKELDGVAFSTVPLKIITDEKEYVDDATLDVARMIEDLKAYKGRSGSSCPNAEEWETAFGGDEHVFAVTITDGLSGSCAAATAAAESCQAAHPGRSVTVIDSLSTGQEMRLIIEKLRDLIMEGREYAEICREIRLYQKKTPLAFCTGIAL